jgi:hypothetical protein
VERVENLQIFRLKVKGNFSKIRTNANFKNIFLSCLICPMYAYKPISGFLVKINPYPYLPGIADSVNGSGISKPNQDHCCMGRNALIHYEWNRVYE